MLQFLILRLMGRTVTAVLTTYCFQMVNAPLAGQAAQITADNASGVGGGRRLWRSTSELGDPVSSPFSQHHFSSPTSGRSLSTGTRCLCKWQWWYFTCLQGEVPANPLCTGLGHSGSLILTRIRPAGWPWGMSHKGKTGNQLGMSYRL